MSWRRLPAYTAEERSRLGDRGGAIAARRIGAGHTQAWTMDCLAADLGEKSIGT